MTIAQYARSSDYDFIFRHGTLGSDSPATCDARRCYQIMTLPSQNARSVVLYCCAFRAEPIPSGISGNGMFSSFREAEGRDGDVNRETIRVSVARTNPPWSEKKRRRHTARCACAVSHGTVRSVATTVHIVAAFIPRAPCLPHSELYSEGQSVRLQMLSGDTASLTRQTVATSQPRRTAIVQIGCRIPLFYSHQN